MEFSTLGAARIFNDQSTAATAGESVTKTNMNTNSNTNTNVNTNGLTHIQQQSLIDSNEEDAHDNDADDDADAHDAADEDDDAADDDVVVVNDACLSIYWPELLSSFPCRFLCM